MGRRKSEIERLKVQFMVPTPLFARLQVHLASDLTQSVPQGARSELLAILLRNYLDEVDGLRPSQARLESELRACREAIRTVIDQNNILTETQRLQLENCL